MCMVSNIGDAWGKSYPDRYPWAQPYINPIIPPGNTSIIVQGVSQEEFNKLKKEVEELKKLLIAAKEFDEASGQPDCEMDEKIELIKRVAELVGVDIEDLFGN